MAKCEICGETRPEPKWFCLARAMREAVPGKPCAWSVEGHERLATNLGLTGAKIKAIRDEAHG